MKRLLVLLSLFMFSICLYAQDFVIERGTDVNEVMKDKKYLYSDFQNGRAMYNDEAVAAGTLNYNMLTNKIQTLSNSVVLDVVNQDNIVMVVIGDHTLVKLHKGFGEVIGKGSENQLVLHKRIDIKELKKGGYGVHHETAQSYNFMDIGDLKISKESDVEVKFRTEYYLLDKGKHYTANKKNFQKIFSKNKNEVKQYIDDNDISFSNENNLKQLFEYCVNL